MKDELFKTQIMSAGEFSFNDQVTAVFDDMIRRSVPSYEWVIELTGIVASQLVKAHTQCYDLGCSLGASLIAMRRHGCVDAHFIGIDNSVAMLASCEQKIVALPLQQRQNIYLRHEDITTSNIDNASLVAMNFTLQFIPVAQRQALIDKIYAGLIPGGGLILSEKMNWTNPLFAQCYDAYKRFRGYSDIEIERKREALDEVLITESIDTHQQRLRQSGFTQVDQWLQCFNFSSLLAIKPG